MNREKRFPPFLAFLALAMLIRHKSRHHRHHHFNHSSDAWQHHCRRWHSFHHDAPAETPQEYV